MATNEWEVLGEQPAVENDWEVLGEEDLSPDALLPGEALNLATAPDDQFGLGETQASMASALTRATSADQIIDEVSQRDIVAAPPPAPGRIEPTALTATRTKLPGGTVIPEPTDPDADLRAMKRLPGNIGRSAKAQTKEAIAGTQRLFADLNTNMQLARAESYQDPLLPSSDPRVIEQQQAGIAKAEDLATQGELAQGRAARTTRRAQAEGQAAIPADAGEIERAIQSGVSSALVTIPIVTLGSVVPGGQGAALVTLGGMTGSARYGELRAAGLDEGTAALSGAALGGLEGLTEKFPLGTLAKRSPFVQKATEFLVQDLLGENVSTVAQIADDYRLGLRDDVTMADVQQAIKETSAATIAGSAAQLTVSGILEQALDRANQVALDREAKAGMQRQEPFISEPTLPDAPGSDLEVVAEEPLQPGSPQAKTPEAPEAAELAALEALRKGGATPEQEAIVEGLGHLVRTEEGAPVLLPSGRRRLTELKQNQDVSRKTIEPAAKGDRQAPGSAQPQLANGPGADAANQGEAALRAPAAGASPQEKAPRVPADASGDRGDGGSVLGPGTALEDTQEIPAQVEQVDLTAVRDNTATPGQIGMAVEKGYAKRRSDGTAMLLPAGRRRLVELESGQPPADFEATWEGEDLRRAGDRRRTPRVEVKPSQARSSGVKAARGGVTVHVDGKPAIEFPDAQAAREAAAGLTTDGTFQTTVAGQTVAVDVAPTDAQKAAGNYAKGHIRHEGLDITIENPKGSIRSGVSESGRKWHSTLRADYGYVRGSESADGDHVDVFLGDDEASATTFVIDQVKPDGTFDEHKVMLRYPSQEAAERAYKANYPKGWKGLGAITAVPIADFKKWVKSPQARQPYAWKPKAQVGDVVPSSAAPPTERAAANDRLSGLLERALRREAMEAQGRDVLDEMSQASEAPRDVGKKFWSETYYKLNAQTQRRFQRYAESLGFKPGDVLATKKDGSKEEARDWQHVGEFLSEDLSKDAADLEGTERGFVALMKWANVQAEQHESRTAGAKEQRPAVLAKLHKKPATKKMRLADLPRDMREDLYNHYVMFAEDEAIANTTERAFYTKSVPMGEIDVSAIKVGQIPDDQLQSYIAAAGELPPIVIVDGRLWDGWHRVAAAQKMGVKTLRYIDVTGLINSNKTGFIAKLHKKSNAFKKWFGDSKVVDENGDPLVVYHGTNQSFDDFSKERLGMMTNAYSATAFYFTSDNSEASLYAETAARRQVADIANHEKKIAKIKADIAKAERAGDWTKSEALMEQWEQIELEAVRDDVTGANVMPVYLSLQNPLEVQVNGLILAGEVQDHIDRARRAGHDGVIFRNIEDAPSLGSPPSDHFVVFEPAQIKSATGNRGTFDPANPDIRMHKVFHGSPHRFDKFVIDETTIGTGEGAAAFGWGLYFAENKAVAEEYQRRLSTTSSNVRLTVNGEVLPDGPERHGANLVAFNDLREIRATTRRWLSEYPDSLGMQETAEKAGLPAAEYWKRLNDFVQRHKKKDIKVGRGSLYTVEIDDAAASRMMDWDAAWTAQPDSVKETLRKAGVFKRYKANLSDYSTPMSTRNRKMRGENIYEFLVREQGSPKAASKYLSSLGIHGMRYKDAGSRDKRRGTRNLVVFDDSIITVTHVDGTPVTARERDQALKPMFNRIAQPNVAEYRNIVGAQRGQRTRQVRDAVDRVLRGFPDAAVTVTPTFNELPNDVRARVIAAGGLDENGDPAVDAFYDPPTGQVYFIAAELDSLDSVESLFMHEYVAHKGLAGMLDKAKRDEVLNGIARDLPDLVRQKCIDYGYRFHVPDERRIAAEEVIAEMAETYLKGQQLPAKQKGIVQRLIQAIADVLRRLGLRKYDEKYIASLLTDLHRYAREGHARRQGAERFRTRAGTAPAFPDWDDSNASEVVPNFQDYVDRARLHLAGKDEAEIYSYALKQFDERQQLWQWEGFVNEGAHVLVRGSQIGGYDLYIDDVLVVPDDGGNYPNLQLAQAAARAFVAEQGGGLSDAEAERILDAMPLSADLRTKFHRKPFFSQLDVRLSEVRLQKGPPAQWRGIIANLTGKGVSPEEIQWLGVNEWLGEQEGKVTKEQVLDFVRANQVQVEEVLKGAARGRTTPEHNRYAELQNKISDGMVALDALGYSIAESPEGDLLAITHRKTNVEYEIETGSGDYNWVAKDGTALPDDAFAIASPMQSDMHEQYNIDRTTDDEEVERTETKYETWKLPGGENYRELLLTLPPKKELPAGFKVIEISGGRWGVFGPGEQGMNRYGSGATQEEAVANFVSHGHTGAYKSSHWAEPNILTHVRFDERTDADGKRVLFVEEIQSDWHQAGRRKGYRRSASDIDTTGWVAKAVDGRAVDPVWAVRDGSGQWVLGVPRSAVSDERSAIEYAARHLAEKEAANQVPNAPFKTSWPELAFKRILKWAVDENFDRVAWTTGAQQAERYNLGQVLDSIQYAKEGNKWRVRPYAKSDPQSIANIPDLPQVLDEKGIEEHYGVEVARMIVANEGDAMTGRFKEGYRRIDAAGLRVGEAGMTGFYDHILPKTVAKLTKKWGGKVSTTKLTADAFGTKFNEKFQLVEEGGGWRLKNVPEAPTFRRGADAERWLYEHGYADTIVHSLDVTDDMREVAHGGLPMFHRKSMVGVFRRRQAVQNGTFDLVEGSRTSRWWNLLVFKAQDRFYDLFRLNEQAKIFRQVAQLPDSMDAYLKETLYHGRVENRVKEYEKQFIEPLVKMIKDSGYTWQQVEDYLYARHAPEANARLLVINNGNPNFHSGMTDAEATQVMTALGTAGNIANLQAIGAHVDAMTQWERSTLVLEGLEDQATITEWENTYDHYVPLKGWAHNPELAEMPRRGRGFDTGGRTTKDRTGRTSRAGNILANIVAQAQMAVIRAEKAKVGRALLEFVKANPAPRLYEVNQVEYHRYIDSGTGLVRQGVNPQYKLADNVVRVRVGGKDEHIVFNPTEPQMQRVATAMKNLSATEMGLILSFLHGINRYLSTINTSLNPEFVVSNALRDLQTAGINLQSTDLKGQALGIMGQWRQAWTAIRQVEVGNTTHAWAPWWERFKKAGAKTGWIQHYGTPVDIEKMLQKEINRHGVVGNVAKGIEITLGWIERQNLAVENAMRLATFRAAIDAGMSDERAAQIAKNLTVNFNKRGDLGIALNSIMLFYNAGVQGTATILRAAKSPRARKFMYGLVAAGIAIDIINRMVAGEDDDDENRYDKIRSYEKERNIIVMLPKEQRFTMASGDEIDHLKIPMPYGYNFLYYTGTKIGGVLDYHTIGNKRRFEPAEDAVQVVASFLGAFNPIGGYANPLESITAVEQYIQLKEERSWDGRPLMPPQPQYDIPLPDSQRYWRSASRGAREVTNWLNENTGGTDVTPGTVDISPATVDYWIDFALGGTGRFISNTINATHDVTLDRKDLDLGEVPFVRRVLGQTGERDRQERFYTRMNEVQYVIKEREVAREMRRFAKTPEEMRPYEERNAFIDKRYPIAAKVEMEGRRAEAKIKQLRAGRKALQKQEGRMEESKRQERIESIEAEMRATMDQFNRSWNEAEDAQRGATDTKDLIGQLGPLIDGKNKRDAVRALREAGKPATADLIAALPTTLRAQLRELLEKEAAS